MFEELIEERIASGYNPEASLKNLSKNKKAALRVVMTIQQGFRCFYCKEKMTLETPKNNETQGMYATFEHLIDVFTGNGYKDDRIKNIRMACYCCNSLRGKTQNNRARRYYSQFFFKKDTMRKFIEHPNGGWKKIIEGFGAIPDDFN